MKNRFFILLFLLSCSFLGFSQVPTANFKSDITGGCSPIVVNFQDLSTGNPTAWDWDFGNGATSTRQNPSTTYFAPGTYTVKLTASNLNGANTVTKTAYITVYIEPTADFIVNKRTGCSPTQIQFGDNSSTPAGTTITSWKWDFGDGGTSTQQNPQYIYRNPGSYTVTLTITNDKGCTKLITKPNFIDVTPGVIPSFTYNDPGVCSAPSTIGFINNSSGPGTLSYSWNLGNGTKTSATNPTTTYTTNGKYTVSLIVNSNLGCTDSTALEIVVGKVNTDFIIPSPICPKATVQFANNSNPRPIKALWQFSNGIVDTFRNGSASFATPGTYTVRLINTYTVCTDTLVKTITVLPGPTINFTTADTGKCQAPLTVNFNNTSSGTSYVWDFGDSTATSTQQNPSHTYTKNGEFDVTLVVTGTNGCVDTLKKTKYIKIDRPIISFPGLPAQGCLPFVFNFSADIKTSDLVTSYKWDFGDGSGTSILAKPSYTYTNQGTYAVSLTITTKGGCTETFTLPNAVRVGTQPVANFTSDVTSACADPGIQFTNLSTNATEFIWELSDGTRSTAANPRITFSNTGWIDVTLRAINNGCENKITKLRYAFIQPPVSKFGYKPDCSNRLQYTFSDSSIGATTWLWNFGDGTTFNGKTPPIHTFPAVGTYNVSLTTTNGSCTYTITRQIIIAAKVPNFISSNLSGCKPINSTFTALSPDINSIKSYEWNFGIGQNVATTSQTIENRFDFPGYYDIKLITIDSFGCKDSIVKSKLIYALGPLADFTSTNSSGCKGLTAVFTDATKTEGAPVISWKWEFGDGTSQTYASPPFQHTYDSVGDYDVKLVVKDANGCSDSIYSREFVKISTLKSDWSSAGLSCPNGVLGFVNQSKSDLPVTFYWDFGDGQTSNIEGPVHSYLDTGLYTVKLIVQDIIGCKDSTVKNNFVRISNPKASFDANNFITYCTPFEARFTNTSYFFESSLWDLNQGTSNQTNPVTYYTNTGTYPIKLVVTSPGGCKDSITQTLRVFNPSDGTLTYSPLNGCIPLTVNFDAFSAMNGRFIWDFGDGNVTDTTINKIDHLYTDFGDFVPKIILKEPSGTCIIPLTGTQTINLLGVKAHYALDKNFYCDSGYVQVADSTTFNDPIVSYNWDFGDGTTYNSQNPRHKYLNPGIYDVSLIVRTQSGCADTLMKGPVKIVQSPLIDIQPDTAICLNDKVLHSGIMLRPDTSFVQWRWSFPNGNISNVEDPTIQQYKTAGNFTYTAIATNTSGCADTVTKNLVVNPLPVITLPASMNKLVGVPLLIPATYSSNVWNYSWTPSSTLDCSNCPQPTTTTKFNTKYTVTATDSNSCKNTASVQVIVLCKGATIFIPNTFSPNNDGSNDILYVRGVGLDRVKSLRIFNRWGEVVFEAKDFAVNSSSFGWDGKYKGKNATPDVYIYQVEVFCENGEIIRFEGNVALIQ